MRTLKRIIEQDLIFTRKYILVATDIFLLVMSLMIFGGMYFLASWNDVILSTVLISSFILVFMMISRANRSLWQYAGASDYLRFMFCYALGLLVFHVVNIAVFHLQISYVFIAAAVASALLASLFVRLYIEDQLLADVPADKANKIAGKKLVAIIGAGNAGVSLLNEILRNPNSAYAVWGFFDDDPLKIGQQVNGVPVRGVVGDIQKLLPESPVKEIILAIPSLDIKRRREIIEVCNSVHCHVKIMPDAMLIMEKGGGFASSIRDVRVEDLLGRTSVTFSKHELDCFIKGKTVLVTGGGGSIGAELCRQMAGAGVKDLIIFDICENDSYMLIRELQLVFGNRINITVEIGSIVDESRVNEVFRKYRPDVVFHAAAHKHVPLMETCPYEAVHNNIFGTYNVLTATKRYRCPKFVLISTDKAINPTNVMGATKRYCELMVRAMAGMPDCEIDYVAVRFGNVLGSHGSVLPLFQIQLEHGGPITITDRRITRYFMTIPEAAGLVIKAAAMAKRSEVFILNMGQPVRIIDLAENFIRLSGYEPYTEIPIIETGLRPGEKLYEELLINDREHKSTSISKIFIEKNLEKVGMLDIQEGLKLLREAMDCRDDNTIVGALRRLVPTFKTPEEVNSKLDKVKPKAEQISKPESTKPYQMYQETPDLSYAYSAK